MENSKKQQVLSQVIQEAWGNAEFKAALLADPVPAIEALTGETLSIPEGKTLVVRDQTSEDTIYINIPAQRQMADVELDEAQLDAVAGGTTINPNQGNSTVYNPFEDILDPTTPPTVDNPPMQF